MVGLGIHMGDTHLVFARSLFRHAESFASNKLGDAFGLLLTANVENTDFRRERNVVRQVKLLEVVARYHVVRRNGFAS